MTARTELMFSKLCPAFFEAPLQKMLIYAGIEEEKEFWIGRVISRILLVGLLGLILPLLIFKYQTWYRIEGFPTQIDQILLYYSLPLAVFTVIFASVLYYVCLFYKIEDRKEEIEKVLPDFLLIVVSNLHAGLSPFEAFIKAARPDFGPLKDEIKKTSTGSAVSQSLTHTFIELSKRVDSPMFQKTVLFFEKAVRSGGQTAKILQSIAREIRHIQEMRAELIVQSRSYVIFLIFMILLIAPFLFSVSTQFLSMFLKIKTQIDGNIGGPFSVPMFKGEVGITVGFVEYTIMVFLFFVSLFISFFIGSILRGKPLYGIKYFPVLATASIAMYFISKTMISGVLVVFS